jgi:hypothetical protein
MKLAMMFIEWFAARFAPAAAAAPVVSQRVRVIRRRRRG